LVARKVGQLAWRLYAAALPERAAPLRSPGDLANHQVAGFDAALSRMLQLRWLRNGAPGASSFAATRPWPWRARWSPIRAWRCCLRAGQPPPGAAARPPEVELPLEDVWLVASREAWKVPRVRALMGFLAERFEESRSLMLGVR
ncbi:hypothetical protein ACFQFD_02835, partial [Halobaculum halobium]